MYKKICSVQQHLLKLSSRTGISTRYYNILDKLKSLQDNNKFYVYIQNFMSFYLSKSLNSIVCHLAEICLTVGTEIDTICGSISIK